MVTAQRPRQGKGVQAGRNSSPLRSTRPSLLDLRFTGDPWVAPGPEGAASLCLDDYCLVRVIVSPLDVPSFYQTVIRMRNASWRARVNPARPRGCAV